MAKTLQFRRGTSTELDAITGAEGEIFVDLDTNSLRVHDGNTQSGFALSTLVETEAAFTNAVSEATSLANDAFSNAVAYVDAQTIVEISDTAPSNPSSADLWWDSSDGVLKIYYDDGDTQQWVDASPTLNNDFVQQNSVTILTPTGITPASNSEVEQDTTFTLTSSDYDFDGPAGSHESSDWQVSLDPAFGNTVVESLNDTTNLTSYEVTGGISTEDTFYWRVRHRDSEGRVSNYSTPIEFDTVIPPPDTFGQSFGGGIYMGAITAAGQCYALIVAPNATGCAGPRLGWKTTFTLTAGTDSLVDGYDNTYGPMDNADHPAGNFCATRTINGFSDWYLPAIDELEKIYDNGAVGCPGSNINESVIGSGEAFDISIDYWSSTEKNVCFACRFSFSNYTVGQTGSGKFYGGKVYPYGYTVRAVRREPI